jgi:hypothetical protein
MDLSVRSVEIRNSGEMTIGKFLSVPHVGKDFVRLLVQFFKTLASPLKTGLE